MVSFVSYAALPRPVMHRMTAAPVASSARSQWYRYADLPRWKGKETHLHVGIFDYTLQVINDCNSRRSPRVEPCERVGREDHLVIMLDEEVEHVRNEHDERLDRAFVERPWQLGLCRARS